MRNFYLLTSILFLYACTTNTQPKPKGYLSLKYPENSYQNLPIKRPYLFKMSKEATIKDMPKNWLIIQYPNLKATIDITYRPIENNLNEILQESEKLVYEHTIKSEQIFTKDFINEDKKVFGSLYEITGNAASQIQFHATDSTNHFIKGALFFYAKPNYDSILPAVDYLKKDMIKIMETLQWN